MNRALILITLLFGIHAHAEHAVMSDVELANGAPTTAPAAKSAEPRFVCDRIIKKGVASVYGLNKGKGDSSTQRLAGGGRLNVNKKTAAIRGYPMHTWVEVTNQNNGLKSMVYINDRGPYAHGRILDLSPAAARAVGIPSTGNGGIGSVIVRACKKI